MNDDDPGDVVHERFAEPVLGAHPLGRPIGGTAETIAAVDRDHIAAHFREHYIAPRAGRHGGRRRSTTTRCAPPSPRSWPARAGACSTAERRSRAGTSRRRHRHAVGAGGLLVVRRPTEQANVVLGTVGLTATDDRRYAMSVLNAVLGGGMSSRLFQEVRERRGLAYSVYSFASGYSDAGCFGLYAGCTPAQGRRGRRADAAPSWSGSPSGGVADDELARGKGQLARRPGAGHGGHRLADDAGSGKAELVYGEYVGRSRRRSRRIAP